VRRRSAWLCLSTTLLVILLFSAIGGCSRGPVVVRSVPGAGATGLPVDSDIVLTFDRPMDPETIGQALALTPPSGNLLSTMSADGTQLHIRPQQPLAPDTQYTLALDRRAQDTGGARLRQQFSLHFRTAARRQAVCDFPVWSPDGNSVTWLEDTGSDRSLWIAGITRADGQASASGPLKLADGLWPGSQAVFSPDGQRILVVTPQTRDSTTVPGLAYVDPTGGIPQQLALNEQLEDPSRLVASFSPDGSLLAVQNDMYMADAHSDYMRQLGVARSDGTGWSDFGNLLVGWGTDGSWLIYLDMPGIGEAHSFSYDVWRYDSATGTRSKVPGAPKINNFGAAARSPDGLYFVFSDWQAEDVPGPQGPRIEHLPRILWRLSADGRTATQLTGGEGRDSDPSVSAEGTLVFASDRSTTASDWDIWSLPAAQPGGEAANLTARPGYDGQPVFAPGGDLIAYVSDASGNREVWLMRPDGTDRRMVSFR